MAYATGATELDRLLDGISTAQANPDEIFPRLRDTVAALSRASEDTASTDEAVYSAFRNAVWTFVASGDKGPHLDRWADLILRVRQLLRVRKSTIAERLTTLADFLEKSGNAADEFEKIKLGKHHRSVLNLLQKRKGESSRAELLKEIGLRDSNFSHVLSKLAAARLIDRIPIGREATIRITDEGRKVLSDHGKPPIPALDETPPFVWTEPDCALAIVSSMDGLVKCNAAFASIVEATVDQLQKMPVTALREILAAKIQNSDFELNEITSIDGCTRRLIEKEDGNHTYWLAFDVTAYKRKIDELKKRERALSSELSDLRAKTAALKTSARSPQYSGSSASYGLGLACMMQEMTPDVMTPVRSIAAIAHMLSASTSLKGSDKDYLSAIITNSNHLKNVLGGMIAVADADMHVQVAAPFYPNSVAKEIANNFTVSSRKNGYTIFVDPSEDHLVLADGYAFKAALQTTVAEVINAVPSGASVGIRTTTDADGVAVLLETKHMGMANLHAWPNAFARCNAYVSQFGARVDFGGYDNGVARTTLHWPLEHIKAK
ncbi:hypothetical protein G8O24_26405 [Bradyrhizobium sp. INPA01-394B]|uniref:MarR family transcriptional regulator n=1 Tax=Bradyrhizobium campsiandrae TaxID=1729892 RepID=A0ABR7U8E1_9BRAD|nr:winged helix DNA-binding protein [Bradyrhizobium campsiandrae]MBC9880863.1 hypothetical protein [Bradyrhizobium campsiandrae]MBC9980303.1 hypothetical protein [Bradyrhizobium campsiandrae]